MIVREVDRDVQNCDSAYRDVVVEALRSLVSTKNYPCVAAIRSILGEDFSVGTYRKMGCVESTRLLSEDLKCFIAEQKKSKSTYLSFVAAFQEPTNVTEKCFEELLWDQLSRLHELTSHEFSWDPKVCSDTSSPEFCFSFANCGFFIVGMHPASSRKSRQFPFPVMVFNLFEQFEELKRLGMYEAMKTTNRERDMKYQGSLNPMLERFGETAEAVQYSGRNVGDAWKCPFRMGKQDV